MLVLRRLGLGVALIAMLTVSPVAALAQTAANSGQIVGQVVDTTGAAVVDAEITIRSTDTNHVRRTTTDSSGRYAVTLLPLATYEVVARRAGFEPARQEVVVTLGASPGASFQLAVAGITEDVAVSGGADSGTHAKAVLTDLQVQNLPASGRRIRSLFQLTPGTQIEPECGGFAVAGQKGTFINMNVDGGDYTSPHWCGHVEFSPTIGLEALQEMQVLRGTFSAEFGRSTGGIVNLSTKSGTNQLRGTGYYLFRNDALTKTDPFGRQSIGVGQQFGASIGGPVVKDRTFFFVSPEFQRNTKEVETLYAALDTQKLRGVPAAQALLAVAPEGQHQALSQSRSVISRLDHRLNDRHGLMARFDYTRNSVRNNVGGMILSQGIGVGSVSNRELSSQAMTSDRNTTAGVLQFTSVLSNRFLNEFRVQVLHEARPWHPPSAGPEVTVRNAGASVAIYGPQASGLGYGNVGYQFSDTRYHIVNNVSFVTGAHTAKLGIDANLVNGRTTFDPGSNGVYTFNSLADFEARRPFQYQQFAGTGTTNAMMNQVAFYLQDEWRLGGGVTISPGLRYEIALLPDYPTATVAANRIPMATSIPDAKDLIAPRLGLAWDLGGDSVTVLRAAAGLFYAAPHLPIYEQAMLSNGGNPELSSQVLITTAVNPNAVADAFGRFGINLGTAPLGSLPVFTRDQLDQIVAPENRVGATVNFVDPDFRLPRATHARIAIERQLGKGLQASLDFTNINTTRIARVRNLNLAPPVPDATGRPVYTGLRPYGPKYGFVNVTESSARSSYQGLTAALNIKRPQYIVDLFYTISWSKSYDDLERPVNAIAFNDAFNLENEYNWSNIDQRHQVAATGLIYLPKQLELSTTMRFNSGRPFSALAGADLNKDGVLRDRAVIDGQVIRRNTYRNSAYSEVNLRLQRGFLLTNGSRIILSAELFNLFDTDNVEVGSANMVYGPGVVLQNGVPAQQGPRATFGQLTDASGNYLLNNTLRTAPFQAQLGLRFQF